MNRRGFLGSILAAAVAPAIVRADSLMRIVPMETAVALPRTLATYGLPFVYPSDKLFITGGTIELATALPAVYSEAVVWVNEQWRHAEFTSKTKARVGGLYEFPAQLPHSEK